MIKQEMDWGKELHNTVVKSLVTSFGLDFLLFQDKKGGDVDTIHNVRQGIYATDAERKKYDQRPKYDPCEYHKHPNYIKTNIQGKKDHQQNKLKDAYTNQLFAPNEKINLDHTISAAMIHHDPGRILAEARGSDLANHSSNLHFTNETINKSKKNKNMNDFIKKMKNEFTQTCQKITELENKPSLTEQDKKYLKKLKNKKEADFNKMREIDEKARTQYEKTVNTAYYTSSKFAINLTKQSAISGFKMGTREMLGLILAEVWFELRDQLPAIYQNNKYKFNINNFLNDISNVLQAIWNRIKIKFKDFLNSFKDGAISGVLSSTATTITNIFFTTQKILGKMIREMWGYIIQVIKLIFFNPQSLSLDQLVKEASKIISSGISIVCGGIIYNLCSNLFLFPFGPELSAFCGALATGILTLAFNYYLENGDIPQKIWEFLKKFNKCKYKTKLEFFKNVNEKLDIYLNDLAKLECNLNTKQFEPFLLSLTVTTNELERSILLEEEIIRRNIKLPFEAGNLDSLHIWLKSL